MLKQKMFNPLKTNHGFSLMEIMVSLFILMILMTGVYNLIIIGLKLTDDNKKHVEAIEIANQKMEILRGLPYADVGVVLGSPAGIIPQEEIIQRSATYKVNTYITFFDDPYDGQIASATNPDSIGSHDDYKIATIKVTWSSGHGEKEITVFSKIVPDEIETDNGTGIIKITINDYNGNVIPSADVRVYRYDEALGTTTLDVTNPTNQDGVLYLSVATGSDYVIEASKTGYSTSTTYAATSTNPNPDPEHLSVSEGVITAERLEINQLIDLNIKTVTKTLPNNWRANTGFSGRSQTKPILNIASNDDSLYYLWKSESATSSLLYAQKYDSAHNKVWANEVRVSTSTNFQGEYDMATDPSGNSYITWQDNSKTLKQIAFARDYRLVLLPKIATPLSSPSWISELENIFSSPKAPEWRKIYDLVKNPLAFDPAQAAANGLIVNAYIGSIPGTYTDHTITAVSDVNKAFVLMRSWWTAGNEYRREADELQANAYLLDTSTVRVTRGNANGDLYYSFYVIEARNDEFAVRGRDEIVVGGTSNTDSVTGILDDSKVVVFANSRSSNGDYSNNHGGFATVSLSGSSPTWTVTAERTTSDATCYVRYVVVEWLDSAISVQNGEYSGSIDDTEVNDTLTSAVDTSRTWLYSTMRHSSNGLGPTSLMSYLHDANTIGFRRRTGAGSYNSAIRWWTIEFPAGVSVQRGFDSAGSSDANEYQSITQVDLENSWSDTTRACYDSGTRFPRDHFEETLSSDSELRWRRAYTGNSVEFAWQVIDTSAWVSVPDLEISAEESQIATSSAPQTDVYLGGIFAIKANSDSNNISDIKINQTGSIDGENSVENLRLLYDNTAAGNDCSSESFSISDSQFGATLTNGFEADSSASFTDSVNLDANEYLCVYVVFDTNANAGKNETIEIEITDPVNDVTAAGSSISPATPIELSSTTVISLPALINQIHYRFRNDDGDESGATWMETQDSSAQIYSSDQIRLRFELSNSGSVDTGNLQYKIQYDEGCDNSSWIDVVLNDSMHWKIIDSLNLTDADPSTNSAGIFDENITFVAGEIVDDNDNLTANINLTGTNFTEIEYSLSPTPNTSDDNYCFRLIDSAEVASFNYMLYPQISVIGDKNIFFVPLDSSGGLGNVKKVNSDAGNFDQENPKIALSQNGSTTIAIVWEDERNGNKDVYMQLLTSTGTKIWASDLQVTSSSTDEYSPGVTITSNSDIIVTWLEQSGTQYSVKRKKYDYDGNELLSDTPVTKNGVINNHKMHRDDSGNYYIAWSEYDVSGYDINFNKYDSSDNLDWSVEPNLLEGNKNQTSLSLGHSSTHIFATWTDDRNGDPDVYSQKIDSSGNLTWAEDQRLNIDIGTSTQSYSSVAVNSAGTPYAAWQDNRENDYHIYTTSFTNPGTESNDPNTPLTITWKKKIGNDLSGDPIFENYSLSDSTDASGDMSLTITYSAYGYSIELDSADTITLREPSIYPLYVIPGETETTKLFIN